MLDLKFVREHLEEVEQALEKRGQAISLDEFRRREVDRRQLLTRLEELRHERNTLSQEVGGLMKAGKKAEAQPLRDRVTAINDESKSLEAQAEAQDAWVRDFLLNLPNLPHESVPVGASSDDNPVAHTWGEAPRFDFEPRAHWDIGESLGILDFERAAKITGARFALLKGPGARLERALINFMLDLHTTKHGYT
ncbi:MAG: serine--tRNA ligase, partial [Desulfobaccales bacterium]